MTNPNELVGPVKIATSYGQVGGHEGLTKREFFSALALQSILINKFAGNSSMAEAAVFYADQLIEELNKEQE